ncbi:unnamed protein product [Rotaria socialis]|uniref:Uncharacterized protein n=1 Tax=Rotaria socialis TaxID=392032 RepID=A0A820QQV4_9BILA|nr:unnamed protein product [Rotaria socialis]CAF3362824.1 unnamed protein product [Rotaria socialis]CAF3380126.1 unnamed protein product [Rotaria socialis]CAF3580815.1 unnamed protein product [Rotaria socialis]CAF3717791.1 unnamed protein product [Rotaria socialis]
MLYAQKVQNTRQNQMSEIQRMRSDGGERSFLLCSNQYAEKLAQMSRPTTRPSTPTIGNVRSSTLLILTPMQSLVSLNNTNNNGMSILNIVSSEKFIVSANSCM